jgi:hypothetical protein
MRNLMASEEKIVFQNYTRHLLNRNSGFVILLVLTFLCVGFINILNHEMWRDELQAWLSAINSSSIASLFDNIKYDGHPGLWNIILYFLSRFTDQPIIMQLFHLIIATATTYFFVNYSPFTKLQKILFVFGYFPLYEYATISRNYGLGIFFVFTFCTAFRTRFKNCLIPFFILFMLTQTNVYGLIIAVAFGLILLFELIAQDDLLKTAGTGKLKIVGALSIFILGIASSIFQLIPPPDSGFAVGWRTSPSLLVSGETLSTIWKSYIPIPSFAYHFWNSNIMTSVGLQALFGCILLCLSFLLLLKKPKALILYLIGSFGILAFTYVKYLGRVRHHGHLFILFIACLWISNYYPDKEFRLSFADKLGSFLGRYKNSIIVLVLCTHLIAGIFASGMDWVYPFSTSKEVAKFITDKGMKDMPILGYRDSLASAVSGHLNRPIYYPNGDRFGSFVIFDQKRLGEITDEEVLEKAQNLIFRGKRDLLLVLSHRLNKLPYSVVMLREFDAGIVRSEMYFLYLMRYDKIQDK